MIATLCWKEYREQRGLWLGIFTLAVISVLSLGSLAQYGIWRVHDDPKIWPALLVVLTSLVVGHSVICGASLLAGEKETGTLGFLDTLAPRRISVWHTKLVMGCLLTVPLAMILAGMTVFLDRGSWLALPLYAAVSLGGLLSGMAAGAICRSVFPAILLGVALTLTVPLVVYTLPTLYFDDFTYTVDDSRIIRLIAVIYVYAAASVLAGYLSWRVYCGIDEGRREIDTPKNPDAATIAALCWKEFREQSLLWVAIVILGAVCIAGLELLRLSFRVPTHNAGFIIFVQVVTLTFLTAGHGIISGANVLAGDRYSATLPFWGMLLPGRTPRSKTKLAMGGLLTVSQALILAGMTVFIVPYSWPAFPFYVTMSLVGLLSGMAARAICRSIFPAILLGAGLTITTTVLAYCLITMLVKTLLLSHYPEEPLLLLFMFMNLAASALLCVFSRCFFYVNDGERSPVSRYQSLSAVRPLFWLAMRQGRWVILAGLGISAIAGFYLNHGSELIWTAHLLIGIACGICVFAFEQPGEQERFLGAQRFPPGKVWLWKTVFWFGAATLMAVTHFLMILAYPHANSNRSMDREIFGIIGSDFVSRHSAWFFTTMWAVFGFCVGQFFGLLSRRIIVAVVVSVLAGACYLAVWLPAIIFGGITGWQFFAVPLLLLLANRFSVWTWFSGRLFSRGHIFGLIGCGSLAALWLTGCLWYRAVEIPDVGEPFDVAAFNDRLKEAAQSKAGPLIREAAKEMSMTVGTVTAKLGPPTKWIFPDDMPALPFSGASTLGLMASRTADGPFLAASALVAGRAGMPVAKQGDKKLDYLVMCDQIMIKGWPKDDAEIGPWFDAVFAGLWAEHVRQATKMPPGLVADPRTNAERYPDWQKYRRLAMLFAVRALQLQAHGHDDDALAHLEVGLALSRQMRHCAPRRFFIMGEYMEGEALTGFDRWLFQASLKPKQLRKGLVILRRHESLIPDTLDSYKADYVWTTTQMDIDPGQIFWNWSEYSFAEKAVVKASWEIPWERDRQLRTVNIMFQLRLHHLESPQIGRERVHSSLRGAAFEYELPEPDDPVAILSAQQWNAVLKESLFQHFYILWGYGRLGGFGRSLADVRVRQLYLALALYQAEHNKPADKLDDLVPAYLPALPRDPVWNRPFSYKISAGEEVTGGSIDNFLNKKEKLLPGQGVIWMVNEEKQLRARDVWYFPVPLWSKK